MWVRSLSGSQSQIFLHIQPGARRTAFAGLYGDDRLKLVVQAPPVEGAANQAVIEHISSTLRLPRSRVTIVSGLKSRSKTVLVDLQADEVRSRIPLEEG